MIRSLALAMTALLVSSCSSPGPPEDAGPPDVLLLTVDTFRADRAGCMGHPRGLTPALDRILRGGLQARNAFAPAPLTAVSHASLLTGLEPPSHGVRDNGSFSLSSDLPTLGTVLRSAGFRTGAFIAAFPLDSRFGFANGFDEFEETLGSSGRPGDTLFYYEERPAAEVVDSALAWLETIPRRERALVWAHFFDPHFPRKVPRSLRSLPGTDDYGREIFSMDREIARLLREFRTLRGRGPILAVASDHGEALGDHGESSHGILLYEESMRSLFGLSLGPGGPRGIHEPIVRHADLLPTLLDALELSPPHDPDGRSLLSSGETTDGAYGETYYPAFHYRWSPLLSWRTREWTYVEGPRPELYHRPTDPGEHRNVIDDHAEVAARLARRIEAVASEPADPGANAMDDETRERLAALGYVGTDSGLPIDRTKNPAELIDVTNALFRGITLFSEGDPRAALRPLQRAFALEPENASVLFFLASCFRELGDKVTAMSYYRRSLEILPGAPEPLAHLALLEYDRGNHDLAFRLLDEGLAADAENFTLLMTKGDLTRQIGEIDGAGSLYRRASEAWPRRVEPWIRLAEVAERNGDARTAQRHWDRALEVNPQSEMIPLRIRSRDR